MNLNLRWTAIGALTALLVALAAFWTLLYGFTGLIGLHLGIGLGLAAIAVMKGRKTNLLARALILIPAGFATGSMLSNGHGLLSLTPAILAAVGLVAIGVAERNQAPPLEAKDGA